MGEESMIKSVLAAVVTIFAFSLWASGGQDQRQNHPGVYAVPVAPAELIRYSLFSGLDIEVRKSASGAIKIEYSLPLELTGVENQLDFEGMPDGTNVLTLNGPNGTATCEFDTVIHRCEMVYKNIIFNSAARDQLLEQLAMGDADALAYRKSVAAQFEQIVIESPSPAIHSGAILRGGEVHRILIIQ